MLRGEFESAGELEPDALRGAYDELLAETVERVGRSKVAAESGVDGDVLDALLDGERPDLSLTEAAAVLAADGSRPDADSIEAEARDILLMGMTTAVLDVEAVAAGVSDAMDPKEIQQKIEGRYPMSLDDYAVLHAYIASQQR